MKAMSKKVLAIALAVATVFTMGSVSTVTANAATKSNVTVNYGTKKVAKPSVKSISVSVDGEKAAKNVKVYLTGKKAVKVKTAVTVTVKGKKVGKGIKNVAKVTYASSDKKVASVTSNGVITVKKAGKATITVTSKAKGNKKYKINLTAVQGIQSMTIDPKSTKVALTEGDKTTIVATVKGAKNIKKTVFAQSSDRSVVKASVKAGKNGKTTVTLTAVKAGTATVKIGPKYGSGKDKVITVTVNEIPTVKYTKVVFDDKTAKKVDLKGKVTVDVEKDSKLSESVTKVLAAIGGDYTVTIAGKTIEVKDGKTTADLAKLLDKKTEKTDVTVECTKTIAEMLKMIEEMKLEEDIAVDAKFSVVDDKIGEISAVSLKKTGEVSFTFAKTEFTAFVKGGDLYLVGDQVAFLKAITTIADNKTVVKDFEAVYAEVR